MENYNYEYTETTGNEQTLDEFIHSNASAPIEEAGVYDVRVTAISENTTQAGVRVILATLKTASGQTHYERFFLSSKARFRLAIFLNSLMIPPNDIKIDWNNFDAVLNHLQNYAVDRSCRITIEAGEYNGKPQYQVKKFEALPEGVVVETSDGVPF